LARIVEHLFVSVRWGMGNHAQKLFFFSKFKTVRSGNVESRIYIDIVVAVIA
jgi:hypothetical protein